MSGWLVAGIAMIVFANALRVIRVRRNADKKKNEEKNEENKD